VSGTWCQFLPISQGYFRLAAVWSCGLTVHPQLDFIRCGTEMNLLVNLIRNGSCLCAPSQLQIVNQNSVSSED